MRLDIYYVDKSISNNSIFLGLKDLRVISIRHEAITLKMQLTFLRCVLFNMNSVGVAIGLRYAPYLAYRSKAVPQNPLAPKSELEILIPRSRTVELYCPRAGLRNSSRMDSPSCDSCCLGQQAFVVDYLVGCLIYERYELARLATSLFVRTS